MATADAGRVAFFPRTNSLYPYRNRMGMIAAAEFVAIFDDFVAPVSSNTPNGWSSSVADAGASVTTNTTAAIGVNGVLTITSDGASEGAAFWGAKSLQLTAGKNCFVECRVRCDNVADNAFQFGLSALTATTNPEDVWTTVAADLVAFGILDGAATVKMLADKSNSGSTAETGTRSMVIDTWHILAIFYNGLNLLGYVDGKLALTWAQAAATIPTGVALAPFVGALNGNGAGDRNSFVDYFRVVMER